MKVNFHASLRPIIGQKTVEFDYEKNLTVSQLLDKISHSFPAFHQVLYDKDGEIYPHAHVYINGRDVPYLEKTIFTVLNPNDKIDIFPPGHF